MRTVALVLLVVVTCGCGDGATTPTAPIVPPVAPGAQSFCSPPTVGRVYTVPVPGHTTPASVWLESITPSAGAMVRAGDSYTISSRQFTPSGYVTVIQFLIGDEPQTSRSWLVWSGGCGSGTFRSQVPPGLRSPRLTVRIWVRPGEVFLVSPVSAPASTPDVEASEPLDWTIVP